MIVRGYVDRRTLPLLAMYFSSIQSSSSHKYNLPQKGLLRTIINGFVLLVKSLSFKINRAG